MGKKRVFVTVGTTEFDELFAVLDCEHFLSTVRSLGFDQLVLQCGHGVHQFTHLTAPLCESIGVDLRVMAFTTSMEREIREADLVIGHAGAGTVLEVISCGKPFVCVVNDTLQGNHQQELANALKESDSCIVTDLKGVLSAIKDQVPDRYRGFSPAPSFPIHHPEKFAYIVDSLFE